jgi:hypothetical protein
MFTTRRFCSFYASFFVGIVLSSSLMRTAATTEKFLEQMMQRNPEEYAKQESRARAIADEYVLRFGSSDLREQERVVLSEVRQSKGRVSMAAAVASQSNLCVAQRQSSECSKVTDESSCVAIDQCVFSSSSCQSPAADALVSPIGLPIAYAFTIVFPMLVCALVNVGQTAETVCAALASNGCSWSGTACEAGMSEAQISSMIGDPFGAAYLWKSTECSNDYLNETTCNAATYCEWSNTSSSGGGCTGKSDNIQTMYSSYCDASTKTQLISASGGNFCSIFSGTQKCDSLTTETACKADTTATCEWDDTGKECGTAFSVTIASMGTLFGGQLAMNPTDMKCKKLDIGNCTNESECQVLPATYDGNRCFPASATFAANAPNDTPLATVLETNLYCTGIDVEASCTGESKCEYTNGDCESDGDKLFASLSCSAPSLSGTSLSSGTQGGANASDLKTLALVIVFMTNVFIA